MKSLKNSTSLIIRKPIIIMITGTFIFIYIFIEQFVESLHFANVIDISGLNAASYIHVYDFLVKNNLLLVSLIIFILTFLALNIFLSLFFSSIISQMELNTEKKSTVSVLWRGLYKYFFKTFIYALPYIILTGIMALPFLVSIIPTMTVLSEDNGSQFLRISFLYITIFIWYYVFIVVRTRFLICYPFSMRKVRKKHIINTYLANYSKRVMVRIIIFDILLVLLIISINKIESSTFKYIIKWTGLTFYLSLSIIELFRYTFNISLKERPNKKDFLKK
jgi:uncharacterized membrane protein